MDFGSILTMIIGGMVSAVLIIIGIVQIKKKTPVGFYTGETPPLASKLKSVRGWNTGHGLLWISYGVIMLISFVIAVFTTTDPLYKTLLLFGGTIIPTLLLVLGHHLLIRKYLYGKKSD